MLCYEYLLFVFQTSNSSSYVLVMTAIDRYQAICNPLSNFEWTPKRSNIMISLAWTISLVLCIPQVIIFSSKEDSTQCVQVHRNFRNVNSRDLNIHKSYKNQIGYLYLFSHSLEDHKGGVWRLTLFGMGSQTSSFLSLF